MSSSDSRSLPMWADIQLSSNLGELLRKGEGPHLELKRTMPKDAGSLGKEVAAFATSGGGRIVVGADEREIVGIVDGRSDTGREDFVQRVQGIVRDVVKPQTKINVRFAVSDDKVVAVIDVPDGRHPIYYHRDRPILRCVTASRPAEPQEVVDLVLEWAGGDSDRAEIQKRILLVADLAATCAVFSDEIDKRSLNPWFEQYIQQSRSLADLFRETSAQLSVDVPAVASRLIELAESLEELISYQRFLGMESHEGLLRLARKASESATLVLDEVLASPLSRRELNRRGRKTVQAALRKLNYLEGRIDDLFHDPTGYSRIQREASEIGGEVASSLLLIREGSLDTSYDAAIQCARRLHVLETYDQVSSGEGSFAWIVDQVRKASCELRSLAGTSEP